MMNPLVDSSSGRLSAALLLLYYIQGNYAAIYDKPLFDAPCEAWVHGPVYRNVYNLFRDFKYNPIDDDRFVPLKESALPLTPEAKEVVDRVLDTFGMYSGKGSGKHHPQRSPLAGCPEGFSAGRNFSCGDFAGCDEGVLQKGG